MISRNFRELHNLNFLEVLTKKDWSSLLKHLSFTFSRNFSQTNLDMKINRSNLDTNRILDGPFSRLGWGLLGWKATSFYQGTWWQLRNAVTGWCYARGVFRKLWEKEEKERETGRRWWKNQGAQLVLKLFLPLLHNQPSDRWLFQKPLWRKRQPWWTTSWKLSTAAGNLPAI